MRESIEFIFEVEVGLYGLAKAWENRLKRLQEIG